MKPRAAGMPKMPRRMSCFLTTAQVRSRTKTETSRDPATWTTLKVGEPLVLVEKAQGLKRGEKQIVLATVRVTANYLEPLNQITPEAVAREGFPGWTPAQFIAFYTTEKGGTPERIRRVIRWEYLEKEEEMSEAKQMCKNHPDREAFVADVCYDCLEASYAASAAYQEALKLTPPPAEAAPAASECSICGGKGEVSAYMRDGDTDEIPCPTCVSRQLNEQLAQLRAENERLKAQLDFQKRSSAAKLETEQEHARQNRDNFMSLYKRVQSLAPTFLVGFEPIDITHEADKLMSAVMRFREKETENEQLQQQLAEADARAAKAEADAAALRAAITHYLTVDWPIGSVLTEVLESTTAGRDLFDRLAKVEVIRKCENCGKEWKTKVYSNDWLDEFYPEAEAKP